MLTLSRKKSFEVLPCGTHLVQFSQVWEVLDDGGYENAENLGSDMKETQAPSLIPDRGKAEQDTGKPSREV